VVEQRHPLFKSRSSSMPIEVQTRPSTTSLLPWERLSSGNRHTPSKSRMDELVVTSSPGQWEKLHKERVLHASSPELFWKYYYGPDFAPNKSAISALLTRERQNEPSLPRTSHGSRFRHSSPTSSPAMTKQSSFNLLQQVDALDVLLTDHADSRQILRQAARRSGGPSLATLAKDLHNGEALMHRRFSVTPHHGEAYVPESALAKIELVKEKFLQLDSNGDSNLEFDEVSAFIRRGQPAISDRHVRDLCARFDKDHDGKINFDEFVSYLFASSLARARQRAQHNTTLKKWFGPEAIEVNGVFDGQTKRAFQRFVLAQGAPTALAAGELKFVNGTFGSGTIIALQELMGGRTGWPKLLKGKNVITGTMDAATTRALHQLVLDEGAPTAEHLGDALLDSTFGFSSICALQEFLIMLRTHFGDDRL